MAETNSNRFSEIEGALLLTEYNANKKAYKELEATIKEQRDEIERRLNAGMTVENSKTRAELGTAEQRTYSIRSIITAIRKYKLDAASLLKAVNKAVKELPEHIRDSIPYVTEHVTKVNVKARK